MEAKITGDDIRYVSASIESLIMRMSTFSGAGRYPN